MPRKHRYEPRPQHQGQLPRKHGYEPRPQHQGQLPRKHRYEPRPQHQGQLQVPEARLKSYGARSFGFSAPTEWNKLPIDVK